ncbi:hypothetical protein JHL18_23590 [Clostridium sp. YIM B02505]|uniref:SMI1/KNR4 family protein n=1 Tax=Clostridium yunnanense TaxID=2800325 RepID=A0ABS1EW61_9CLOT|nr:hypothetical protein [Clostridium yunnanense]MBK1813604.1 hypothetical protein [Clostridium yunnanense]
MERMELSEASYDMLRAGKKVKTIKDRDEMEKVFIEHGIPVFDEVISFQEQFGGIWYKIGEKFYRGFRMDMFSFNEFKDKYELLYFTKEGGKYFFQCMDYHYAGDIGPCIDEDGKVYYFGMGQFFISADTIEEFLDDEAIRFSFVNKYPSWLTRGSNLDEINKFKKDNIFIKIKRDSFSDKYFEWWCNKEETIFIRIDLKSKYNYAIVFCKNQEILNELYESEVSARIYP